MFIEKVLYFKEFIVFDVIFHKDKREMLWMEALKRILGRARSWLKLSYRENRVDPPITQYIQLRSKATDSFDNPEGANVLLSQLFYHSNGGKNWIALMELDHCLVPNFYKQRLVAPVVMLLIICEGEWYCIGGSGMGDIDVGEGGGQTQV